MLLVQPSHTRRLELDLPSYQQLREAELEQRRTQRGRRGQAPRQRHGGLAPPQPTGRGALLGHCLWFRVFRVEGLRVFRVVIGQPGDPGFPIRPHCAAVL
jgi:hypothetical protein